ncbi:MAG: hypothetical protein ACP5TY_07705 [Thermodesulforhabdaceae bacterium]
MISCPWPENPIFRLPTEISEAGVSLALNAETAVPFAHFGNESGIPAFCRLCPSLFEGECFYPDNAVTGGGPPWFLAWAAGTGRNPIEAVQSAATAIKSRLEGCSVGFFATVLVIPQETTVGEFDKALEGLYRTLLDNGEDVGLSCSFEFQEVTKSLVVIAAWAPSRGAK